MLKDLGRVTRRAMAGDGRFGRVGALALAAGLVFGAESRADEHVVIRGGHVHNASGEPMEGATVLITDGVIAAVGADVEVPYDAKVFDVEGKVVFPGMVLAHTTWGLDRPNENTSVTPYVDVYDALDPNSTQFEQSRRSGITTLHVIPGNNCVMSGRGRIVRPDGMLVEEMTVRTDGGMKVSVTPKNGNNRMTQMAELRKAFDDLEKYLDGAGEKKYGEEQEKAGEKVLIPPDEAAAKGREMMSFEDIDQRWQNLYRLRNGEIALFLHCATAADLMRGVEMMQSMDLMGSVVFVLGTETHKVVDVVKETGRPVILDGNLYHRETDPLTGDVDETFVPSVFAEAGVPFALQTGSGAMGEGFLWFQAARLVREGLDRSLALGAITQVPADLIGMGDKLGSIAAGKHGNLVILSGDPLDQATVVEHVFVEGKHVYDRSTDRRLQELLSGKDLPVDGAGDE